MTTTALPAFTSTATCPTWCTDHTGFDDGSEDWHKSLDVEVHGFVLYASTGTLSGRPEIFVPETGCTEGMTLHQAHDLGTALLALVEEARA